MNTSIRTALAATALAAVLGCAASNREMATGPDAGKSEGARSKKSMAGMDHSKMVMGGKGGSEMAMGGMDGMDPMLHLHMPYLSPAEVERSYRFRLETEPSPPVAGQETMVHVYILTPAGNPVQTLQVHHERLAHFLLVSENLEEFHHLHPEDFGLLDARAREEGRFSFPVTFRLGGRYLLGVDVVSNRMGAHKDIDLSVQGPPQGPTRWRMSRERLVGDLRVRLVTTPWQVETDRLTVGTLQLSRDGQPVMNLTPYLGALAHLAIFRAGASASAHNHGGGPEAVSFSNLPPAENYSGPKIYFEHTFNEPGRYRVYTQFQTGGTVHTVPFDLEVAPRQIDLP